MKTLLERIVRAIVDYPEEVKVTATEEEATVYLKLHVHSDDIGRVIGKKGRVASSIRTVLTAASTRLEKRVRLDIVE
ncbi:KH domain-containing protein [Salsuginibacillus kocurii]|uniref:KH domain-containing protein n=1 Tax=Salsuginibacillus kocurii TaxID=427078 RepID=UPI00036F0763|nr:KH domain-containing protein [Salsuginibacillus kocurii]